jgi:hypothetical protein
MAQDSRPEVIVEWLFDNGLFFIAVRNIGASPALKITVRFDQKFLGAGGKKEISTLPLFRNIEFLGPQREIIAFVDRSSTYFQGRQPTKLTAKISYRDSQNKFEDVVSHDLEIYRDLPYVNRPRCNCEN